MIEQNYQIAGRIVTLRQDWDEPLKPFAGFVCEDRRPADFTAELYAGAQPGRPWYGVEYRRLEPARTHVFTSRQFPAVRLTADPDWTRVTVEGCRDALEGVMEVFLAAFYSLLARTGGLLVHASLVKYRDEALLFTAASGVGKTTQAELWLRYRNARILNGDKAILCPGPDGCVAWGSPWRGSSSYVCNECAPLKAVVVLEQAGENRLVRLDENQAMARFFPHVFYPSWDRSCTEGVLASLSDVLRRTPTYLLACRPDREAVELTHRVVWEEGKH